MRGERGSLGGHGRSGIWKGEDLFSFDGQVGINAKRGGPITVRRLVKRVSYVPRGGGERGRQGKKEKV